MPHRPHEFSPLHAAGGRSNSPLASAARTRVTLQFPPVATTYSSTELHPSSHHVRSPVSDEALTPSSALLARVGAALRQVAMQRNSRDASRTISQLMPELIDADRVRCMFYDGQTDTLWHEAADPADDIESRGLGAAGHAARKRVRSRIDRASSDPSYESSIDDPAGDGNQRLLVELVCGSNGTVHAVLVASRGSNGAPFRQEEAELLRRFTMQCGPLFEAISWGVEAEEEIEPHDQSFRPEAVAHHSAREHQGDVVRVYSPWVKSGFWLVSLVFLSTLAYAAFAHVDEYATGLAVVMSNARVDVSATTSGQLEEVLVRPGEEVQAGQVLALLRDGEATDELQALSEQFDTRLVDRLLNPDDVTAKQALVQAVAQHDRAKRMLAQRELRAPHDGVVGEILLDHGEFVAPGEPIVSVVAGHERMELVAVVSSEYRPLLQPGVAARVSLVGHPGHYLELPIRAISEDAFGPAAASRKLGRLLGDAMDFRGTVIFVLFDLPANGFNVDGRPVSFHHGMQAVVDIRVRSERLATVLVPGLKGLQE